MLLDTGIRVLAVATTAIIIGAVCTSDVLGLHVFFSWHPIFMSIGTVLLLSLGVVSYVSDFGKQMNNAFPDRPSRRVVHGTIQFMALCFLILGFLCAWAVHGEFKTSQIAADSSNTAKAHVWIGYIVLVLALANAVVGQYKFIVKARDQRTVAKYHGHVGSMVYFFSLIAACLGIANTMLDKSKEASQHALGITAIVLICLLLVLVMLELMCLPQVISRKDMYDDSAGVYSFSQAGYGASLNGGSVR